MPSVNVMSIVPVGVVMGGLLSSRRSSIMAVTWKPGLDRDCLYVFLVRGPAAKPDYISLNPIKPGYARLPPELRSREGVAALN